MNSPIKKALSFGILYGFLTIVIEVILLVLFRLTIAQNAGLMGMILLLLAPGLAAYITGFRGFVFYILLYIFTVLFTITLVSFFGQTTEGGFFGPATTIIKPLLIRIPSGFVAALLTYHFSSKN